MKKSSAVALCVSFVALAACQTMPYQPYAREVKKKPQSGGVIALKLEHRDEDRQKATQLMSNTCGAMPVKVTEEGEVVVGQETHTNANKEHNAGTSGTTMGTLFGLPITSGGTNPSDSTTSNSVTTAVKEWQITYECETKTASATPMKKTKK